MGASQRLGLGDGHTLVFDDLGAGASTVVLAHNLLSHRGSYAAVAERLAARARVLNVDLRGHGDSRRTRRDFSVADLADDLAALLHATGTRGAVLVGTSLGAAAACELWRTRPDLVGALVLVACNPHRASARDRLTFAALAAFVRAFGPGPLLDTLLANLHAEDAPADVRTAAAAQIRAMDRADTARAIHAWVTRPRLLGRLRGLRVPVRVVLGGADAACPRAACSALAAELGTTVRVIPGAGHTLQAERPDELAAVVAEILA
ncbi:MAG TPA: alpha/beta hydrolase [Nannocystis sp.]